MRDIKTSEESLLNLKSIDGSLSPRIHVNETERLNIHIQKMNDDGWKLKQVQGINTGFASMGTESASRYERTAYGLGGSFTEGVLLFWEK
ncbi:MAG: hypothetical protein HY063_08720 [Bacteroidetes bacterium]|nr:hypothetical protein [Bacteroidota bacterium]